MPGLRNLIFTVSLVGAFVLAACSQGLSLGSSGNASTASATPVPAAPPPISPEQIATPGETPVAATAAVDSISGTTPSASAEATSTPIAAALLAPAPTAVPEQAANGTIPRADVAFQPAAAEALSTVDIVKLLRPSVVHIATTLDASMGTFNQPVPNGVGTGVLLDKAGHILTNNHVIQDAQRIIVTLSNGQRYSAELIGRDPRTDTAVIEIVATDLTPARLGVAAEMEVGEDVIAIGHALGLRGGPTVSKGVVSAVGRSLATGPQTTIVDLIQTDASINPGNSGGPLVNTRGEVVGINTAILLDGQGIGFAINIDDARAVAEQLMSRGYVERGFMGFSPVDLTPAVVSQAGLRLPEDVLEGIVVTSVPRGYPAQQAGLQSRDVIVEMGGQPVVNTGQLSKFLIAHLPGETVEVTFYRELRRLTIEVTLTEQPEAAR